MGDVQYTTADGRTFRFTRAQLAAAMRADDGRPGTARELEAVKRLIADRDRITVAARAVEVAGR